MKPFLVLGVALVGALLAVAGDAVGNGETTNAVSFGGFPGPYSFQRALSVSYNNGNPICSMGTVSTDDGPLAPLTTESHHIFRGPFNLLQFAVYQIPATPPSKRSSESSQHVHHHRHLADKHIHRHLRREQLNNNDKRRDVPWVTATIDGQVASWTLNTEPVETVTNEASQPSVDTVTNKAPQPSVKTVTSEVPQPSVETVTGSVHSEVNSGRTTYSSAVSTICPSTTAAQVKPSTSSQATGAQPSAAPAGKGIWSRVSYFNAGTQTSDNIAFTANNNMTIEDFGFLPGWVAANGMDKATGPSILSSSGFISDNYEVLVSTNALCSAEDTQGGCSTVTPGALAHHGWAGDRVVFVEYQMPQSKCGSNCANKFNGADTNTNLPSWWSLPSTTINIGQYGFAFNYNCTGWADGSGELDIVEVLTGNEPASIGYTSLHMNGHYSGTPPQGFARPDGAGTMKMVVIMSGQSFHIQVLDSSVMFEDVLGQPTVDMWLNSDSDTPANTRGKNNVPSTALAYSADVPAASFEVILG